jgi:hypothetical protein
VVLASFGEVVAAPSGGMLRLPAQSAAVLVPS